MSKAPDNIDLTAAEREEVAALLQRYLPDTEVWAYGSRVKFTANPHSDLDMVAFAAKEQSLREAFEESYLPFRVDLFVWDEVPENFHGNIEEARVVLQKEKKGCKLPEGWQSISFSDAVHLNPTVKLTKGNRYPFVDMKSLNPACREVVPNEMRTFQSGGAKFLPKDTLLARITPCLENGKIARYNPIRTNREAFGSTEFIVIRGKDGVTDNDFVYYLTIWPEFRKFAISQMTGSSGRQRVPVGSLAGFTFNLPPLPEQKAIAHILGSLDDKIELNRRMNETLEAMAQALFKSWFVNFDPVIDNALATGNAIPDELKERAAIRQGLSDEKKSLPDDIRRLFPSEFTYAEEMGWIPKGWEVGPLRLIATYCSDRIPTSELTLENYVSTENILAEKKGICTAAKLPTVKTTSSYQSGNVLVSNIRPYFKKIWFAEGSGGCSNDILNFTVKELNTEEYLLNLLWQDTFFDYMMTTAKGSKMPRGDKDAIMNWKIVIPPVESRQLFAETVRGFYEQISENYKINTVLTQLSDKLLTRLLSGEIRIKQSEQTLGDRS